MYTHIILSLSLYIYIYIYIYTCLSPRLEAEAVQVHLGEVLHRLVYWPAAHASAVVFCMIYLFVYYLCYFDVCLMYLSLVLFAAHASVFV